MCTLTKSYNVLICLIRNYYPSYACCDLYFYYKPTFNCNKCHRKKRNK